jgi:hypothetical protein
MTVTKTYHSPARQARRQHTRQAIIEAFIAQLGDPGRRRPRGRGQGSSRGLPAAVIAPPVRTGRPRRSHPARQLGGEGLEPRTVRPDWVLRGAVGPAVRSQPGWPADAHMTWRGARVVWIGDLAITWPAADVVPVSGLSTGKSHRETSAGDCGWPSWWLVTTTAAPGIPATTAASCIAAASSRSLPLPREGTAVIRSFSSRRRTWSRAAASWPAWGKGRAMSSRACAASAVSWSISDRQRDLRDSRPLRRFSRRMISLPGSAIGAASDRGVDVLDERRDGGDALFGLGDLVA